MSKSLWATLYLETGSTAFSGVADGAYSLNVCPVVVEVSLQMAGNSFDLFMNGGHHEQQTKHSTSGQKKKRRNGAKARAPEPVSCPLPRSC